MILALSVFIALLLCGCTTYCYEDTVSDMEIMYGRQKIKCLGGYWGKGAPSPFFIDCSSYLGIKSDVDEMGGSLTFAMEPSMIEPGTRVVYTDFTVHLSKYIEKIYAHADMTVYTVDGEKTAYCPRVSIICDEDNKTFYSKDGKLYYRQDDTLVDGFLYADNGQTK